MTEWWIAFVGTPFRKNRLKAAPEAIARHLVEISMTHQQRIGPHSYCPHRLSVPVQLKVLYEQFDCL
ncbi:MAG: hypothetical protein EBE86_011455 [Hormoscilla sp. GUM202]|nr:hypothetical protein [Hormoscilla sp. GUM202]